MKSAKKNAVYIYLNLFTSNVVTLIPKTIIEKMYVRVLTSSFSFRVKNASMITTRSPMLIVAANVRRNLSMFTPLVYRE